MKECKELMIRVRETGWAWWGQCSEWQSWL